MLEHIAILFSVAVSTTLVILTPVSIYVVNKNIALTKKINDTVDGAKS